MAVKKWEVFKEYMRKAVGVESLIKIVTVKVEAKLGLKYNRVRLRMLSRSRVE